MASGLPEPTIEGRVKLLSNKAISMRELALSDHQDRLSYPILDFLIVTALPEERDAVLHQLGNYEKIQRDNFPIYYRSSMRLEAKGDRYEIAVLMLNQMGNVEAAHRATQVIQDLQPAYVLMVGIAGGVKGAVNLGDVVVAEQILYYAQIKRKPEGPDYRPSSYPADSMLWNRARNFTETSWRDHIPVERSDRLEHASLKVHFAPVAAGEEVIADREVVEQLKRIHSKMAAVEMESFGVAVATANATAHPGFLAIRGICDYADSEKNDDWHKYAAASAAAFAIGFLHSRPVQPRATSGVLWRRPLARYSKVLGRKTVLGLLTLVIVLLIGARFLLPQIAVSFNNRGLEYYHAGQLDGALTDYQLALALNPDYVETHYNLGVLYEDLHDLDRAKAEYKRAILGGLDAADNNLGRLYLLEKDYETAVGFLLAGLDRVSEPDVRYDLLKNLGWARLGQGRYDEARAQLQAAIDLRFDRAPAHCLLAQVLEFQHDASSLAEWSVCLQYAEEHNSDEDAWIAMARERLRLK